MYDQTEVKRIPPHEKLIAIVSAVTTFVVNSIEGLITAIALSIILYLFFLTPHEVVGISMFPTYENSQQLLGNKILYRVSEPERGDVVVFKHSETEDYIKRVIAISGDSILLRDGKFYLNGVLLDESAYLDPSIYTNKGSYLDEGEEIVIPEGMIFVCGDNRPKSYDSRFFGPIPVQDVKAKIWLRYYPFDKFTLIKDPDYQL